MSTPLSDPDNVQFFVVDDYVPDEDGFTDDEVQRILNGEPLVASVAFEANESKYDGGGMIALIPSDADLNRLALDGEEPRDDLHLTLWYLGDDELDTQQREDVLRHTVTAVDEWYPIGGNAFGVALWNPNGEHPAWVLNVGDASDETTDDGSSNLAKIRGEIWQQVSEDFVFPQQHTPWQPHICIAYSNDDLNAKLRERLGFIEFDKVRVAFGRDVFDIELDGSAVVADAYHLPGRHDQDSHAKRQSKSAASARSDAKSGATESFDHVPTNADFTEQQENAINTYTSLKYKKINGDLKKFAGDASKIEDAKLRQAVIELDNTLAGVDGLEQDTVFERGMNSPEKIFGKNWKTKDLVGETFKAEGYSSAVALTESEKNRSTAEWFAVNKNPAAGGFGAESKNPYKQGVVIRIVAPKGSKALRLTHSDGTPLSEFRSSEVILPRGLNYRVTKDEGFRKPDRVPATFVQPWRKTPDWVDPLDAITLRYIEVEIVE